MQVLDMKLKRVIQWAINKKQAIYELVVSKLPIYRAIKEFIELYIHYINQLIQLVQKTISDINNKKSLVNNQHSQTVVELFYLIREKELVNLEEWKDKLWVLDNKFKNKTSTDNRQVPDIFSDIDANILYYNQLRTKLSMAKTRIYSNTGANYETNKNKQKQTYKQRPWQTERYTPKNTAKQVEKQPLTKQPSYQLNNQKKQYLFRKYNDYGEKYDDSKYNVNPKYGRNYDDNSKKDNTYKYDYEYNQPNRVHSIKSNHPLPQKPEQRQKQKVNKTFNYDSPRQQLSPYKLVNPKYSPFKQKSKQEKIEPFDNYRFNTEPNKYTPPTDLSIRNENYKKYKEELFLDMDKDLNSKANPKAMPSFQSGQDSPIKKFKQDDFYDNQPSTTNTDKYQLSKNNQDKYFTTQKNTKQRHRVNIFSDRKKQNLINKQANRNNQEDHTSVPENKNKKYQYLFDDDREYHHLKEFERTNDIRPQIKKQKQIIERQKTKQDPMHKYSSANYNYRDMYIQDVKRNERIPSKSYKYYYQNYLKQHQNQKQQSPRQKYNRNYNIDNDSLQLFQQDRLGSQLQVEMPTILNNQPLSNEKNLEHLLADSLLESKKWDSQGQVLNVGEDDSLEEQPHRQSSGIRHTGKFNQLLYTDENEQPQQEKQPIKKYGIRRNSSLDRPLSIQKVTSSESKDLNVSFGRN